MRPAVVAAERDYTRRARPSHVTDPAGGRTVRARARERERVGVAGCGSLPPSFFLPRLVAEATVRSLSASHSHARGASTYTRGTLAEEELPKPGTPRLPRRFSPGARAAFGPRRVSFLFLFLFLFFFRFLNGAVLPSLRGSCAPSLLQRNRYNEYLRTHALHYAGALGMVRTRGISNLLIQF